MSEVMDDYDAGFEAGKHDLNRIVALKEDLAYEAGLKKAYELVGQLANFYKDNIVCGDDWPDRRKKAFKKERQAQVNACKYAQHVIQEGVWDDEEDECW